MYTSNGKSLCGNGEQWKKSNMPLLNFRTNRRTECWYHKFKQTYTKGYTNNIVKKKIGAATTKTCLSSFCKSSTSNSGQRQRQSKPAKTNKFGWNFTFVVVVVILGSQHVASRSLPHKMKRNCWTMRLPPTQPEETKSTAKFFFDCCACCCWQLFYNSCEALLFLLCTIHLHILESGTLIISWRLEMLATFVALFNSLLLNIFTKNFCCNYGEFTLFVCNFYLLMWKMKMKMFGFRPKHETVSKTNAKEYR